MYLTYWRYLVQKVQNSLLAESPNLTTSPIS